MDSLPIFMKIKGARCVVVGGGEVALRKVTMLLKADAAVEIVSPTLCEALADLVQSGVIHHLQTTFDQSHLNGATLVIAATDDEVINAQISEAAKASNIPVNVVDAPALCTFTMPSIVDRSPVVIAISSNGAAPVLARLIRAKIETMVPASYGRLAKLAGAFREAVKAKFATTQARRIFWEQTFQGPIAELVFSGQEEAAKQALENALEANETAQPTGEVYLVGGGPGDPDLLTFRALRLMQQCDVCVYDKLVSKEVMELVRRDAELMYVGKARDQHTLPQDEINQLLVRLAKQGKRVLRLKGGDPFIFGRGGEEIETLMENDVPFQVVPGITAANGVSTYAGIPLTHRDYAQSCLFTTGHLKPKDVENKDGQNEHTVALDWPALVRPNQTVVIYMGLVGLDQICAQLIKHGLDASTPAAVVQQGTTPKQRVVVGDLSNLAAKVAAAELKPPCLIIIGQVVKLREKLAWFEAK
ncbi:MAG: uroporphyrinogen-III C-methyltransferase [Methylophilaceae bacterium]|jgi:uroporphyrin-III C-methyltransferase / precorrin-2 dehydrogenase / sirohydrochlorin ferrochelatase|nr:uroporphyrinogen-III C-methyltransferase [Methylophilaceae bacterium]NCA26614.1 uroporphyrinogen-III C-methyltransferase [Methylophilaceae bacterium]